jgi:MarR family transcriptional regulator, 2-MHQ and catechol-resistance regulon repressor
MANRAKDFLQAPAMSSPKDWGQRSKALLTILSSQKVVLRTMSASAERDGLTLQQFSLMGVLSRRGRVTMNTLSRELRVTPPNITGVVDRLEAKGLVKRVTDPVDRRKKEIQLTEKGAGQYEKVRVGYSESLQGSLDALTLEEQEVLAKLLRKFAAAIAQREVEGDRGPGVRRRPGAGRTP